MSDAPFGSLLAMLAITCTTTQLFGGKDSLLCFINVQNQKLDCDNHDCGDCDRNLPMPDLRPVLKGIAILSKVE